MAPEPDEHDSQRETDGRGIRTAARRARAEVVDVLAEGLWSLIRAGRWPGIRAAQAAQLGQPSGGPAPGGAEAQPSETAGV